MAYFNSVNGDSQPVFALDTRNGPVAPATSLAGQPVQPQGPKLEFFRAVANVSMDNEGGVREYVANVIQAIQQVSTVAMYQVDGVALSVAVYPVGAFANTTVFLNTANVAYTGFQLDSVTNVGFKLTT